MYRTESRDCPESFRYAAVLYIHRIVHMGERKRNVNRMKIYNTQLFFLLFFLYFCVHRPILDRSSAACLATSHRVGALQQHFLLLLASSPFPSPSLNEFDHCVNLDNGNNLLCVYRECQRVEKSSRRSSTSAGCRQPKMNNKKIRVLNRLGLMHDVKRSINTAKSWKKIENSFHRFKTLHTCETSIGCAQLFAYLFYVRARLSTIISWIPSIKARLHGSRRQRIVSIEPWRLSHAWKNEKKMSVSSFPHSFRKKNHHHHQHTILVSVEKYIHARN